MMTPIVNKYTWNINKLRLIVLYVSDVFKCIVKQLLDLVFAWHQQLFRSRSMLSVSFRFHNNIDLGVNNSWYHAQPRPIIVYYFRTLFQIIEMSVNCPAGLISFRPLKCPVGQMSCRPNILTVKCLSVKGSVDQTCIGLVCFGQMSVGQNVRAPEICEQFNIVLPTFNPFLYI